MILNMKLSHDKVHIMISDGLIFDRRTFKNKEGLAFRRVLNPYQLERALMETDNSPHILLLKSEVVDSWDLNDVQALYDILKIKSYGTGCQVSVLIIGSGGVYENYLGHRTINRLYSEKENDLVMGRTTPTARQSIDHMIEKYSKLRRIMNTSDRDVLDKLLVYGRLHSPEISASDIDHETGFLISAMLELMKRIARLESAGEVE